MSSGGYFDQAQFVVVLALPIGADVPADEARAMLDRFPDSPRGRIVARARSAGSEKPPEGKVP
jgi:hypothetical protein